MIVCPNCNHQNPDGAVQCEACYTPLPMMMNCPNCSSTVQADASFCGQCGFNLRTAGVKEAGAVEPPPTVAPSFEIPDLLPAEPLVEPEPLMASVSHAEPEVGSGVHSPDPVSPAPVSEGQNVAHSAPPPPPPPPLPDPSADFKTQLQIQSARLLHVQTNATIELPQNLSVIHLGKPNDRIPPDVDVSGFPNSEIVSRIHADIRVEGGIYYIEDVGSSNGTYINNAPLPIGNRHRLRSGDRIALGKGDRVTFLFQIA
ncbi:FHA domain-containing protein [Oculatella sp. FACHB-28]|uniref:FHA domain-containing protein n=1 Tax=Oculatella sp. FACHB-28 TaxID=2692845 RepID=UPI001686FE22|nr:FHA domain-containing protein [Oculatella sp. FACHB-28]MBD2058420.1 FHA domain-containing protein [Oculatella sp. FACHB-28]